MNTKDPPSPDPGLLAPLRFNALRDATNSWAKARVLGKLEATLGPLGSGGALALHESSAPRDRDSGRASSRDAETSERDAVTTSPAAPPPPAARATGSLSAGARHGARSMIASFAAQPSALVTAAFVLGGVAGAGIHAALIPAHPNTVYIDRPVAVPEPRPFVLPSAGLTGERTGADDDTAANPARAAHSNNASAADLAGERALLDRARKALAQGNLDDVEQSLESHARRYPTGLLLEEREALAIKSLVDRGRGFEARKRAARFKERFPNSIFGPAVEETLGAIR